MSMSLPFGHDGCPQTCQMMITLPDQASEEGHKLMCRDSDSEQEISDAAHFPQITCRR